MADNLQDHVLGTQVRDVEFTRPYKLVGVRIGKLDLAPLSFALLRSTFLAGENLRTVEHWTTPYRASLPYLLTLRSANFRQVKTLETFTLYRTVSLSGATSKIVSVVGWMPWQASAVKTFIAVEHRSYRESPDVWQDAKVPSLPLKLTTAVATLVF